MDNTLLQLAGRVEPKLILLRGYSGGNTDYKEAKKPKGATWTYITKDNLPRMLQTKEWGGLVIPEGRILCDIDDPDYFARIHEGLKRLRLKHVAIRTPNGGQFVFNATGSIKTQSAKMVTLGGFVCDYRLPGKGYIVLPMPHTEGREIIHADQEPDLMPLLFIPVRQYNKEKDEEKILPAIIGEGSRDDTLFRHAARVKEWNHKYRLGLDDKNRMDVLHTVNRLFCEPPLTDREVEQKIRSAEKIPPLSAQTQEWIPEEPKSLLSSLLKWNDIFTLDVRTEYLLSKLIPRQSINLLFGRGGIGKTSLCMQIGRAVAGGLPFGDLQTIFTPVYYVDFENPLAVLKERVEKIGESDNLYVWHISNEIQPPKLDSNAWELYKQLPPGLIIFDTFRASHLSDENDSRPMSMIMGRLKELREMGFTILLLHHTPKGNENTFKGSTAILDLCDHVLGLEEVKDLDGEHTEFDCQNLYKLGTRIKTRYDPIASM
ncbi:MAG TPA: AAA family ATPase [Thermodesulfovibrionales bacterium]|nr:AAA family ATPase [Thermodesulfovibrionales bacterium]